MSGSLETTMLLLKKLSPLGAGFPGAFFFIGYSSEHVGASEKPRRRPGQEGAGFFG